MNEQQENQNIPRRKTGIWLIIALVVVVIFIILGILFYGLVRENVKELENQNQASTFATAGSQDPFKGGAEAEIVIVEFSDFTCPYCFEMFPVVRELISHYGDQIRFVYRNFINTEARPQSQKAAEAGECAYEQGKFWEMHDKLFINQSDLSVASLKRYAGEVGLNETIFNECLDSGSKESEVQADYWAAVLSGAEGTPTFYLNDREFAGVSTFDQFKIVIDEMIAIIGQQ